MAKNAGLNVPDAKLFSSKTGHHFFGCDRFDRTIHGKIHMHSISGLLDADHRMPSLDYDNILKATRELTKSQRECEIQFGRCVFNIMSHNRDDHAKNFSFLMEENGAWRISPAYDLTFSSGPGGEHCTMVMGEGKNPGLKQVLNFAKKNQIDKDTALKIIQKIKNSVMQWTDFAKQTGVGQANTKLIHGTTKKIIQEHF